MIDLTAMIDKPNGPTPIKPSDADGHILVVDDDGQIRQLVAKFLRENGHRVTVARDGREMRQALADATIDLIILDLMLPGPSGLELCRDLRKTSVIPIIMLTARGADTDRIVGLEIGADDYLAKPFNPRELLARVNAVLRRARSAGGLAPRATGHLLKFEGWTLDTQRRELNDPKGVVIDLSTGEYDLLLTFLEAPQRVLSREQLLDAAKRRIATGFDRAIDVQVSRLRRKIDASEEGQAMIKTIRGTGYMFVPAVTRE
jgi:two-component system OmpR family response regulator